MGCEALGIYHSADSLSCLLNILRRAEPHMYLRDEAVLTIASILGTQRKFYPVLVKYVADNSLLFTLGMDEAESALESCRSVESTANKTDKKIYSDISSHIDSFHTAIKNYLENRNGEELSRWIINLPGYRSRSDTVSREVISKAVLDEELCSYNCLRLVIVHWASHELRMLAAKLK
jgi:hypothetical protein